MPHSQTKIFNGTLFSNFLIMSWLNKTNQNTDLYILPFSCGIASGQRETTHYKISKSSQMGCWCHSKSIYSQKGRAQSLKKKETNDSDRFLIPAEASIPNNSNDEIAGEQFQPN